MQAFCFVLGAGVGDEFGGDFGAGVFKDLVADSGGVVNEDVAEDLGPGVGHDFHGDAPKKQKAAGVKPKQWAPGSTIPGEEEDGEKEAETVEGCAS